MQGNHPPQQVQPWVQALEQEQAPARSEERLWQTVPGLRPLLLPYPEWYLREAREPEERSAVQLSLPRQPCVLLPRQPAFLPLPLFSLHQDLW